MSDTSTMEGDLPVEYYTETGRLESFQIAHPIAKRRDSSTKGRGAKPVKWPHSWLEPKSLAEAGFIYMPEPGNLDNVMCFLCRRSICGWTNGDEPLSEHLKLSPDCGWAITSCIEAKVGDIHLENPMSTRMVEARKATFGDRWPHDPKKGWKCKTKALVEAGWIYKPTYDGDDFAECIYCTLALDGWEPADKPFHEHHARSPDCAFFELCNRPESPIAKKTTTKRKPRASAVKSSSRLSMQSTLEPEPSYLDDQTFATANETLQDEGDSIANTSSIMPKGKGKKATAAKGRKKKAESVAPESDHEMNPPREPESSAHPPKSTKKGRGNKAKEEAPPPPAHNQSMQSAISETLIMESTPKSRRCKKRVSDSEEADESIIAPAPKRRTRNSVAMQESVMPDANDEISSSTPPKRATSTKKKPARASRSRKASEVSIAPGSEEHLDQQLEDELDRQLEDMDVENPSRTHSPEMLNPKPAMAPLGRKLRNSGGRQLETSHHDMFQQMDVDEDEVDREMEKMAEEEEISKPLPKCAKGKKGVERKVSVKQQVKEEKARRKAAEEQAKREQAEREAEELRLRQEAEAEELRLQQEEEEAEELRLQQEAEEAEQLHLQQQAEEAEQLRLQQVEQERQRAIVQAKIKEEERQYQAQVKAEQERLEAEERQAAEEAEARRLELEAEAEERRLELEAEAEEEEERRLQEEEDKRKRVEQEEEEECQRLEAEEAAIQGKLRKKNEAAAAKASKAPAASKAKGKGKAKTKPKSPSPEPEPSPARSPTPSRSLTPVESSVLSPSVQEHSTPAAHQSTVSVQSQERSAISTRSQRSIRTLSPSASPQSSDAENHPPSSRPSSSIQPSSAATARQVLGATTPKTPSRSRNATGTTAKSALVSTEPWQEVDLDTIFAHMRSPNKENEDTVMGLAKLGGDLTEEEREMTVEEWVRWNAMRAEERLKRECEALVGVFEREGMTAARCLEGVETMDG